ncbi:MAG: alpha-galactosidase, partial [Victivallales bacterium]
MKNPKLKTHLMKAGKVSRSENSASTEWSDVLFVDKPEPTISYRSGLAVYEESLINGRFVGRGWNGSGAVNFYDGRINPSEHPTSQAFWLEIDGQLLASDWSLAGFEKDECGKDSPAGIHAVVTLRHNIRPVTVKVHTKLDGTPVITRWIEVTNTGKCPAALSAAYSWSGVLQKTNRYKSHLGQTESPLYSIGYFDDVNWANEGDFHWFDLPRAGYRVDGRYRRNRHRHPMFVLRNNATGEHFIGQLAWSGGYSFEFDLDADNRSSDSPARLFFRAGPDAPPPQRIIERGETVAAPEMHLGMTFGDLDTALQAMHAHMRRSVFMPQPRGRGGWIESGIGPEIEMTPEQIVHAINVAGEVGAEVFFIDAGWYAPANKWCTKVGDWKVDAERFPNGLAPYRELVRSKGMLWGLWMDAERIGAESEMAKERPEWLAEGYDCQKQGGGQIDLTNPEVAKWMEAQICRVIEEHQLDFFRLDYNTNPGPGIREVRSGFVENGYWRYYETLYGIYDRLRARFPEVIFENCAGGGGRTDIGMVRRFSHTWVTDWQIAPRSFSITNGMTMALPPEHVDRLIFGQSGHIAGDFEFQSRTLLFVRPTFGVSYPSGSEANPILALKLKRWITLYSDFVRRFMATGRIYHHTPEVSGRDPQGWGVLELASEDRSRGICGLFQLSAPTQPEYLLRLRGLDASRKYRVTFDNSGQVC